jgi:hypothetical protein
MIESHENKIYVTVIDSSTLPFDAKRLIINYCQFKENAERYYKHMEMLIISMTAILSLISIPYCLHREDYSGSIIIALLFFLPIYSFFAAFILAQILERIHYFYSKENKEAIILTSTPNSRDGVLFHYLTNATKKMHSELNKMSSPVITIYLNQVKAQSRQLSTAEAFYLFHNFPELNLNN